MGGYLPFLALCLASQPSMGLLWAASGSHEVQQGHICAGVVWKTHHSMPSMPLSETSKWWATEGCQTEIIQSRSLSWEKWVGHCCILRDGYFWLWKWGSVSLVQYRRSLVLEMGAGSPENKAQRKIHFLRLCGASSSKEARAQNKRKVR